MQQLFPRPCDVCRRRKVKCDRQYPKCLRCSKYGEGCSYNDVPRTRGKTTVVQLQNNHIPYYESILLNPFDNQVKKVFHGNIYFINERKSDKQNQKVKFNIRNIFVDTRSNVLTIMMSNSLIDIKQKLHISFNGGLEYFGDSPMGLLLTMYALHHPSPKTLLPLLQIPQAITNTLDSNSDTIGRLFEQTIETAVIKLSIEAYFNFFHLYCPIVNKKEFLTNLNQQSPILVYMVCTIGCGYIPHVAEKFREIFCDRAVALLKRGYLTISIQSITALLLMGAYQHCPKEFPKGWLYKGMALRMCYCLGLDRHNPKLTEAENELRSRIWYWSHISDKLFAFSLNRPWTQDCSISSPKYPSNYMLEVMSNDLSEIVINKCTLVHFYHLSELCHLMNMILRKFKFTETIKLDNIERLEKKTQAITRYFTIWKTKAEQSFSKILSSNEKYNYIIQNFKASLMMIYYGTLVQLYQSFSEVGIPSLNEYYNIKCSDAANKAIKVANGMGKNFNFHCITYKFYALSSAIMIQIKNTRSINPKRTYESHQNLINGLQIVSNAKPYYVMAAECLRLSCLLATAEAIDISAVS
ncbi:hypothetical protein K502DRAFT_363056 [Neoconidiobolus thromboides FSU 785]|nr:hypothetical protein K502DRAFT_363056 [Neoconidiobolus thromboides FSU 785]